MYLILALLAIALAAGWVAQMIVGRDHGRTDWTQALVEFRPSGLIGSIVGAVIVTAAWGLLRGRRTA